MFELGIDDPDKQASRDKLTAQGYAYLEYFYSRQKQANPRFFSLAGVLNPERPPFWKSQWDNTRSTENALTRLDPNLEWLCGNRDAKTFGSIPPEHRYGERPRDIAKNFSVPNEGIVFDGMNLDLTCGFRLAMEHTERILRNVWLWEKGFLAVWFVHSNRLERRNMQFLQEHKAASFQEHLENLLRKHGYHYMAERGVAIETYKQHIRSSKADPMVLLIANAARSAISKSAYGTVYSKGA